MKWYEIDITSVTFFLCLCHYGVFMIVVKLVMMSDIEMIVYNESSGLVFKIIFIFMKNCNR